MTHKERIILFLLAALNVTQLLDFMIMIPLDNYLIPYFKISPLQFSFLVGAYAVSAAISGFVTAFLVDQYDRKKVLIISFIGFLIGTTACGLVATYGLLMIARIVAGIFGGILGGQVLSIVADLFNYERRGRAMGAVMSAFAVASTIGVPFSLYLTNLFHFNWHIPFLLIGVLGIVLIPFIIKYIPSMSDHITQGENRSSFHVLKKVLESPAQRSALLFSGLLMVGHFLIIPFINPYLEFNKGFSKELTPMIFLFGGIASFMSAIFLGRFSDRTGKLPVFSYAVFFSLFMVILITKMPPLPFSIVLLFFAVWFVLATGRMVTAQAMISEVVKPEQRGSFMSFNGCIQQLGTGVAAFIAGSIVLQDKSGKIQRYEWTGYISVVVLLITLFVGRFLFRKIDKTIADSADYSRLNDSV